MALPKEPAELEARLLRAIDALRMIENSMTAVVARVPISSTATADTIAIARGLAATCALAGRLAGEVADEVSS